MNKLELQSEAVRLAKLVTEQHKILNQLTKSSWYNPIDAVRYFHWDNRALREEIKKLGQTFDNNAAYTDVLLKVLRDE